MKPTRWFHRGEKWVMSDVNKNQRVAYRKHERRLRRREAAQEIQDTSARGELSEE